MLLELNHDIASDILVIHQGKYHIVTFPICFSSFLFQQLNNLYLIICILVRVLVLLNKDEPKMLQVFTLLISLKGSLHNLDVWFLLFLADILYDSWSPAMTVSSVCISILSMLSSSTVKVCVLPHNSLNSNFFKPHIYIYSSIYIYN